MGLFGNLFGGGAKDTLPPPKDVWEQLSREAVKYGGKRLSRTYWGSIYLGAFAPQIGMALFKGKAMSTSDARDLVTKLHALFGDDAIGRSAWDEDEDPMDLEHDTLHRTWGTMGEGLCVELEIDNHHPTDDPVQLAFTPWAEFQALAMDPERPPCM